MVKKKIAIVAPDLAYRGGVTTVVEFLHRILSADDSFEPSLVSLATGSRDKNSKRLIIPSTWFKKTLRSSERYNQNLSYQHFGAVIPELEPLRYAPRGELTEFLNTFDLVQIVSGTPSWAHVLRDVKKPCCLQVATTARSERASAVNKAALPSKIYSRTAICANDLLERRLPESVGTIFVENFEMLEKMREFCPSAEIVFAPPGVDEQFFVPLDKKDSNEEYIFCVGRLNDPRKNIGLLLQGFALLRSKFGLSKLKLKLASKSNLNETDIKLAKKLGVFEHLSVLIDVSLEELRTAYQNAELFALSSDEEGLGLVIAEAMACGLPVASTDCVGSRVLVRENVNGLLSPVGNVEMFAANIAKILQNKGLKESFGNAGRRIIEDDFSLSVSGQRFTNRYRQILNI